MKKEKNREITLRQNQLNAASSDNRVTGIAVAPG
jgi:hypothetical protein